MGNPVIRISKAGLEELRRRAHEEGRTMVAVLDRVLGVPGGHPCHVPDRRVKELTYEPD